MLLNNNKFRIMGVLGLLAAASASQAGALAPEKVRTPSALELGRSLMARRGGQFVENKGQWAKEARFLGRTAGLNLWYTDHGIRYDQSRHGKRQAVDMFFVGGHAVRLVGIDKTKSRMSVYHGKVTARDIASYREVLAKNVLPGVSMRGYFDGSKPRYDLLVAPGTSPSSIKIGFRGANGLSTDHGTLKIGTRLGGILNSGPVAYQTIDGHKIPVAARWVVSKADTAGFKLGAYDATRPLVIDPATVSYGTYYGANAGADEIRSAVKDPLNGAIIVVGCSDSPEFPGTPGQAPYTPTLNPDRIDAFVARLTVDGTTADYSVLIGGDGDDVAQYVRVDPTTNSVWFAGTTTTINGTNSFLSSIYTSSANGDGTFRGVRDVIGSDGTNRTNFFVARLTDTPAGLDFGVDASVDNAGVVTQNANPRVATVFGTGIANPNGGATPNVSLSGFDLHNDRNGTVQFAISGALKGGTALPQQIVPNDGSTTVDDGHHYFGFASGFLVRFNTAIPTNASGFFAVSSNCSQYIESNNRPTTAQGVVLDRAGRAYVAGTVMRPVAGGALNIDTRNSEATFRTTPNAYFTNVQIDGRFLRASDAFIREYGVYIPASTAENAVTSRNNLEYSAVIGGSGDDAAGGIAASLSHTIVYTGASFAINESGTNTSIYLAGTTFGANNFPHTAGAYGGGFDPQPGTQQSVLSDVFVTRIDLSRSTNTSTLASAANLGVFARYLPRFNDPTAPVPTSVEPAGMVIDKRGNVYITGNLRPYDIIFPDTFAATNEPTDSSASTIPITVAKTGTVGSADDSTVAALDGAYDLHPTRSSGSGVGPFPTVEGFVSVFNGSLSNLVYSSYVGGPMDEMLYAPVIYGQPSPTQNDDLLIAGWTTGAREYNISTKTSPDYVAFGDLGSLITGGSVKPQIDTLPPSSFDALGPYESSSVLAFYPFGYGAWATRGAGGLISTQGTDTAAYFAVDGFVSRFQDVIPNPVIDYTITPTTATIGSKGSQTFTIGVVNVSGNPFPQATDTTLTLEVAHVDSNVIRITDANGAILTALSDGTIKVTIPAGQSSTSLVVQSLVYSTTPETFTFTVLAGSSPSARLTVNPLANNSLTLTTASPLYIGSTAQVTATITLANAPGADTSFTLTVSATDAALLGLPSTSVGTLTVPAGTTTGSTTFQVSPKAAGTATIVASVTSAPGVPSVSASLVVNAPRITGVTAVSSTGRPSRTSVRSGSTVTVTVTYNYGNPLTTAPTAPSLSFTVSPGAFTLPTRPSKTTFSGTTATFTYVSTPVKRLSRSQDVTVVATDSVSLSSGSATITVLR